MATLPIQPQDPEDIGAARRTSMRRARGGGFSVSQSTELRGEGDLEEPDLNEAVRANAPRLPPPAPADPMDAAAEDPEINRRRLFEAAMAGDPQYARDLRLGLLNRLLLRGIAHHNIAQELGVSLSTVRADIAELRNRHRQRARSLDINEVIGDQMAFYDEATALSLRVASQAQVPIPMKLAGVRTALAAKADQTRFLTSAGVFDVLAFRRAENGTDMSDVQVLMQRTEEMLAQLAAADAPAEVDDAAPPPPAAARAPVVVRRRRPGAFNRMNFDDANASNSGDAVVEL